MSERNTRRALMLFRGIFKIRAVSAVPFGVLQSGSVDSMPVALMNELMSRPVTTFTIGYEGKEE